MNFNMWDKFRNFATLKRVYIYMLHSRRIEIELKIKTN